MDSFHGETDAKVSIAGRRRIKEAKGIEHRLMRDGRVVFLREEVEMHGHALVSGGLYPFGQSPGVLFHHPRDLARGKAFLADADVNVCFPVKIKA